jgi:ribonuclease Y
LDFRAKGLSLPYIDYIEIFAGTFAVGYLLCRLLVYMLPRRLLTDNRDQRRAIVESARAEAERMIVEQRERTEQRLQLAREELETFIQDRTEDLTVLEQDLEARDNSVQVEETRLRLVERDLETNRRRVESVQQILQQKATGETEARSELQRRLETVSGCESQALRRSLAQSEIETRRLEQQRILKLLAEDLGTSSAKIASRTLGRALARYTPTFAWPKSMGYVEVPQSRFVALLKGENADFLRVLHELAQVEVELIEPAEGSQQMPIVRVSGGSGMDREGVKLALAEAFAKGPVVFSKAHALFEKHRRHVDEQAAKFGKQAAQELGLTDIHPEIQKMVGSLYWRTSYRQNQFYHSLEVAHVAGVVAAELGLDPKEAKRCGLLHDIGKSLDHKIEGSHAVISADYASRFGETKTVCDTVLSHHNDIVLETPLAYLLKSADTISGARPGARVNIEEGYQIRLSAIEDAVYSFPGVLRLAIMNGGREVHIDVNHKRVRENEIQDLAASIARKIEADVAFPGQIKVLLTRRFEASAST